MKQEKTIQLLGVLSYAVLLVLISLLVFKINDEIQSISELLQLNYMLPVLVYSLGTLGFCFLIFKLFKKWIHKFFAFILSFVLGIPIGLHLIQFMFVGITMLNT